jgi:molybdopterin converting factor small subunit
MKVHVDLYVNLKKYAPAGDSSFEIQLEAGARIETLLAVMKIPSHEERIVLVNGHHSDDSSPLKEGDIVTLFSPLSGG